MPESRILALNGAPLRGERDYVLYWMIANRRPTWNFALQRAVELAEELGKPLVVLEALRCGYQWASDRLHRFILDGMADNRQRFAGSPALYYPYAEDDTSGGKGLLAALGARACAVVTDEFPCFMLPAMTRAAAGQLDVRLEAVDANGIIPMRVPDQTFTRAYSLRRWMHKNLRTHLAEMPLPDPLAGAALPRLHALPEAITRRWPAASEARLQGLDLHSLQIDHSVGVVETRGGHSAALSAWSAFLSDGLSRYVDDRNNPSLEGTSGLSPWLHFGHIGAHQIFADLADHEDWSPERLSPVVTGQREGWWGLSAAAEGFLDELITWRELGYNLCARTDTYDSFESLPEWALKTLDKHRADKRAFVYDLRQLEGSVTHDALWNAAQRQLVREGRMHNYLRMLWGKKILEWSPTPEDALDAMIELNNKYALDGRNPNSYSGIFWVLGRYDRAWGPERQVYGTVRYMSSDNTAKKTDVKGYLRRYGLQASLF